MDIEFFDVGHGACALITAANRHVMIDCASSTEFDFYPGDLLEYRGINFLDLLVLTNYDEDHARGLPNLRSKVRVGRFLVNTGVSPDQIDDLKGYAPGAGIEAAIAMAREYNDYSTKMEPIPDLSWDTYRLAYGDAGLTDENNLSLVLLVKACGVNFLFTGDMECAGMEALLNANPALEQALSSVHVFVAPHHGRESALCDRLFGDHKCEPFVVVISDKGHVHDSQDTVSWYGKRAQGWTLVGESQPSYVLSTRHRGSIKFVVDTGAGGVPTMSIHSNT